MITAEDLQAAIAECKGERSPNANTCIKLAAYYTILHHINNEAIPIPTGYSTKDGREKILFDSGSEFSNVIYGKSTETILPVLDEIMETLSVINPRLYDCAIDRLKKA